jgi:hypothetical protein
MATQNKQRTTQAHGIYDKGTLLVNSVFKRQANIALVLVVALITLVLGWWVAIAPQLLDKPKAGSVIAYYENDYQRYAVDELTRTDRLEQWSCLHELWRLESNWRPAALNKSSHAYGIAQLKPTTWKLVGFKQSEDGYTQVDAGLKYIGRHYGNGSGNICRAYAHHLANGWY